MTANTRTQFRSFARGEITPEMFGRMDLVAYQTGLRTCRNFETLRRALVAEQRRAKHFAA